MSAETLFGRPRLDDSVAFSNLIEALRVAESACQQLAFLRNQKGWLQVRFGLESIREVATKMAQQGLR